MDRPVKAASSAGEAASIRIRNDGSVALQSRRCQRQGSAKRVGGPNQRAVFSATGSLPSRAVQKEILEDESTVARTERLVTGQAVYLHVGGGTGLDLNDMVSRCTMGTYE